MERSPGTANRFASPASRRNAVAWSRELDVEVLGDHVDRLFRAAWAMCGNPHDAEDLVQETYVRVLGRRRLLRSEDDIGYLLRALRNTHVSRLRAAGARPEPQATADPPERADRRPSWQPQEAMKASELFAEIAKLDEPFREVLVAIDVAGLSYGEAARALRVREATITSRLHRARLRVAEALQAEDPE